MRLTLIGLTAAVALAASVQTSSAQFNSRYCSFGGRGSGQPDCSFNTMAQCRMAASGLGRYCGENPDWTRARQGYGNGQSSPGYSYGGNWSYHH
jgi:hypothetical protein